jgi:hypothetical protein
MTAIAQAAQRPLILPKAHCLVFAVADLISYVVLVAENSNSCSALTSTLPLSQQRQAAQQLNQPKFTCELQEGISIR